jgi:hypothetical protein
MPASSVIGWRVCRKSTAFCACAAAWKIARLSSREHLQPVRQVRGVILAGAWRDSEIRARYCLLNSPAAFSQQRQMRPQGHGCPGERHAKADIAARRKGPVEGHAYVIDV